jgi:hypothetical protein
MSARGARRGWHLPAVALVLVLALPGAPIARTLGAACDRCPAGCPMHAKTKKRLGCHETGAARDAHHGCERTPGIRVPGCGFAGELPLAWVAPAVLPPPPVSWPLAVAPAPALALARPPARGADPPDPPPPIAFA